MFKLNAIGKRVLIIGDLHLPYCHYSTFDFLKAVKKKYFTENDLFISMGDEIDNGAISFHESCGESLSPDAELERAIEDMKKLEKIFPKLRILESNHGSLLFRRLRSHQIPLRVLKPLNQILEVGKDYTWHEDILLKTKIGDAYLTHGKTSANGKLCKEMGVNAIQGHYHQKFQITWHKSILKEVFDCFAGCLVDRDALVMQYGKNHLPKPILGVVKISAAGYPALVKMGLTKKGLWDKKLS